MSYTDIHCHMLSRADDGAHSSDMMFAMLDMAYNEGTRKLCVTPHCQPSLFGDNTEPIRESFDALSAYAKEKYPDLVLSLGSELGYFSDWREALKDGRCHLIGDRYLLMDFPADITLFEMRYAIDDVLSGGIPLIIAHVERYQCLLGEYDLVRDWTRRGVILQMNATAFSVKHSGKQVRHIKKLIAKCPLAFVASDGHNLSTRPPILSTAHRVIADRYGEDAAQAWLCDAPTHIMQGGKL